MSAAIPSGMRGQNVVPACLATPRACAQVADEYGSESYRGAVDVTVHDPTGREIHSANHIQDDEVEVDAHGTKVNFTTSRPAQQTPAFVVADVACGVCSCPWDACA